MTLGTIASPVCSGEASAISTSRTPSEVDDGRRSRRLRDDVGPDQRAGHVGELEAHEPHQRDAGRDEDDSSGAVPKKCADEDRPGAPAREGGVAAVDRVRILVERPEIEQSRPEAPSEPPGEGGADQRAERGAEPDREDRGCRWRSARRPRSGWRSRGSGSTGRPASRRRRRRRRGRAPSARCSRRSHDVWREASPCGFPRIRRAYLCLRLAGAIPGVRSRSPLVSAAWMSMAASRPSATAVTVRSSPPRGAVAAGPDPRQAGAAGAGDGDLAARDGRARRAPARGVWPIAVSTWSAASSKLSGPGVPSSSL